jgi:ABC-type transport system involved in cytochrome bd biosynthesis fused ATPase/permease subunit
MVETVLAIQSAILVFAGVLFAYLIRQAKALERTIRAQADHITSMKTLSDTMKTILDSSDERRMLDRLKAYKEFVDQEVMARQQAADTTQKQARENTVKAAVVLTDGMLRMADIIAALLPYAPRVNREALIATLMQSKLTDPIEHQLEELIIHGWGKTFVQIAKHAPEISGLARLVSGYTVHPE